ncbi:PhoX homologous domain, present in p47phox and p40phox [Rhizoctonia solani]|uniref:Sorting nexin MVP1 n=1 Tax=Rhizoctonia solani TaxID=456999 RepID=A0A8H7M4J7_9AGAM|nr:PhoX homologous domain, present in p47phox and p40phox [Rhizoctonia solani]
MYSLSLFPGLLLLGGSLAQSTSYSDTIFSPSIAEKYNRIAANYRPGVFPHNSTLTGPGYGWTKTSGRAVSSLDLYTFWRSVKNCALRQDDGVLQLQWGNSRQHDQGFLAIPFLSELKVNPNNVTAVNAVKNLAVSWPTDFVYCAELSGNQTLAEIALSHANKTITYGVRPDGSSPHIIIFNETTGAFMREDTIQGYARNSTWTRGQAWGIYGFAKSIRLSYHASLHEGLTMAELFLSRLPSVGVPPWDFDAPESNPPADTSAATIAAEGLFILSAGEAHVQNTTGANYYSERAVKLLSDTFNFAFNPSWESILSNATSYYAIGDKNIALIYGDYYALQFTPSSHDVQRIARTAVRRNNNGFSMQGSFVEGPLGASTFDGLDPWSATPSPPLSQDGSPRPPFSTRHVIVTDATIPDGYATAYAAVDPMGSGDTSVNALHRVLATTDLPAAAIERIVNLVSTRPRVSRLEFFIALALAGLAQAGKDVTIEQVAQAAQQNALPEPSIDLTRLSTTTSTLGYNPSPPPALPSFEPAQQSPPGAGTSLLSSGLPTGWWRRQDSAIVTIIPEKQGFLLNRYFVYAVQTERGVVQRRYSEFAWLWDCLIRRYPFRVVPSLPPKRIGPDDQFLEQRRYNIVTEAKIKRSFIFQTWSSSIPGIHLESSHIITGWSIIYVPHGASFRNMAKAEESLSKRVERLEEMSVPGDCAEKLAAVRKKLPGLVDHWTRISVIVDRLIKRREGAAADFTRLTMTLNSLTEHNTSCTLRGESDDCDLCAGVRTGLGRVAARTGGLGEELDGRSRVLNSTLMEAVKSQRDLYLAFQALFARQDRLGGDTVDKLKKRVETAGAKHILIVNSLEGLQGSAKTKAQDEADKLRSSIEKDQHQIHTLLNRRVFIQYCMWHELRVVLHNRENALLSLAIQQFVREESEFSGRVHSTWTALSDEVENMPHE